MPTDYIRVALVGGGKRAGDLDTFARMYARIMKNQPGFKARAFDTYDAAKTWVSHKSDQRRIVFFCEEARDPVADVAAATQSKAKVYIFSAKLKRGGEGRLPDDCVPQSSHPKPLVYSLDSVAYNIFPLLMS